jgi:hypothetical protein
MANAGAGGSGTDTGHETTSAPPPRPRQSAARVRRAIVQVLSPDNKLTPDEVQQRVGSMLGGTEHASIKAQLRVLLDGSYVSRSDSDTRKVSLTDSGRRWSRGIKALVGNRREQEDR